MPIFFLKDKESIKEVMNVFDTSSIYSSLKPSNFKCKIACFGLQKGLSIDLCEVECIYLRKNSVNFSYFFSSNNKIENEENFIKASQKLTMFSKCGEQKTVQGKLTISETLAISKGSFRFK